MSYYYYGFDPTYFLVIIGAVICMIASARSNMRLYPYLVIAPGMAIFLSSVAFNLIGDGLRDALDPKMKR